MADIAPVPEHGFDIDVDTLIIGAGAAGMVAALASHDAGREVLVIEADAVPSGSTALSAGLVPAAGTHVQRAAGIKDSAALFAKDIQAKAKDQNEAVLVDAMTQQIAPVIDWLGARHGLEFSVVDDFDYPGHSRRRMHGLADRAGSALVDALRAACEREGIDIICHRRARTLFCEGRRVFGIAMDSPDGAEEIGCRRLILACNGFGGNRDMVARYMPEIKEGLWFGHDGNRGEAVQWGDQLGAETRHLNAFQGHGNVAHPHGILITWAVIMEGGIQVNALGHRFWDESQGYSEAARAVLAEPGGQAFAIFDERIAGVARQFADFRAAEEQGAVVTAENESKLAETIGVPLEALQISLAEANRQGTDRFGRDFSGKGLTAPYRAVRVTGALFHTQGGLRTDGHGRVYHQDGALFPNLFACGGAACGVSGRGDSGYLSGNGLLSAVALGFAAGKAL
ncbi:MAG: FAD-dependent oxidoreductase [Arenibacterium sp.]